MDETRLPTGKLAADLLRELLGAGPELPAEVLVGPRPGEDASVIEVERGVLVAASDPITMTGRGVGSHAVLVNANDVAAMGVRPRYFLCVALLPVGTTEGDVRRLFADVRAGAARVGAALVGGHTEVTPVVSQPLIVGHMLGTAERDTYLGSDGIEPGHVVLQVGPAPVEGAAVLAAADDPRLRDVDPDLRARALGAVDDPGISIVAAALRAAELGASALHDPTEGGLSAGLWELAEASRVALHVEPGDALWYEPGRALCAALGADPWGTLASGCLLAAFPADTAAPALAALQAAGHPAVALANARGGAGVHLPGGGPLRRYERDELSRVL